MKFIVLTSFLFVSFYCFSQEDRDTSLQKVYLRTKVKSVTIYELYSDGKKSQKLLTSYFDNKANEIKRVTYDKWLTGTKIEWEEFYFYDHTSKLLEHTVRNLKNDSSWRAIFFYDNHGNLIDKRNYRNNKPEYRFAIFYDSLQRKVLRMGYSIDFEKPESKTIYEYDSLGNCLHEISLSLYDSSISFPKTFGESNYRYNAKGQLVEAFNPNDTNHRTTYLYNQKGQLLRMTQYAPIGDEIDENDIKHPAGHRETNRIEYTYDATGLLIQEKFFYEKKYGSRRKYIYSYFKK
jgi:YD repeat-containing protein